MQPSAEGDISSLIKEGSLLAAVGLCLQQVCMGE